jgi:putative FmdB family regulatory protein
VPLYDYVCESCGSQVEVLHSISASGPTTCTICGGRMRRAVSAPAIVFKGSGWAKKDARDASRSKAAKSTTPEASTPAGDAKGSDGAGTGGATSSPDAASGSGTPSGTASAGKPPATASSGGTSAGSGKTPS